MAGLPFLKLGALLLKQLAKPLSARLKFEASRNPTLTKYLEKTGQLVHYITSRITVFASGYNFIGVKPLPAEEALKSGIETWSETFLVVSAASITISEFYKSETKNQLKAAQAAAKEEENRRLLDERFQSIENQVSEIRIAVTQLEARADAAVAVKDKDATAFSTLQKHT